MKNEIKDLILIKVNTRKVIKSIDLMSELISHNQAWSSQEIKDNITELWAHGFIRKMEFLLKNESIESVYFPEGTRLFR